MARLKINNAKTFIPISVSRGDTATRMLKARTLNLAFYDKLQYEMKNNEVAPKTFIRTLKSLVGEKLGIQIIEASDNNSSYTSCSFNEKGNCIGYMLSLPLNKNNRIHNNFARTFLEKNQDLLNYVFNPKILKRITTIFNKGYNTKTLENFYNKNISKETILTLEALNNYLNGKSNKEKIDLLQFMRYKLLSEQNTAEATFYIDKKIEKYNGFKYIRPKAYYDISKYQYNEKLNILNECLAKIIQEERSNF